MGLCRIGSHKIVNEFGCDAILCPPGKFHPEGAASNMGACRTCPQTSDRASRKFLGRTTCPDATFVYGDANADGKLTIREVLRLFFLQTAGRHWGEKWQSWFDLSVPACDLAGIKCIDGKVVKMDLGGAILCLNTNHKEGSADQCSGIPAEIGRLTDLRVLAMPEQQYLMGTIPSEIGRLTKLEKLDLSFARRLVGPIPSEIGKLTHLKWLNVSHCALQGPLPTEIGKLRNLEKINLSVNSFGGPMPSQIGNLRKLHELMISRLLLTGSIPTTIGRLSSVENVEIYGNLLNGTIPTQIGGCKSLKRLGEPPQSTFACQFRVVQHVMH